MIVNDVTAAAVAEAAGASVALVQLGSGLGTRLVVDGRVIDGSRGAAGAAHVRLDERGPRCTCGARGCLQAFAGWYGIRERAAADGHDLRTPGDLVAAAACERWAEAIVADALWAAGLAASILVAAADPGLVRLGGGLACAFGEPLVVAVRHRLLATLHSSLADGTRVELSPLRERAALLGLAQLCTPRHSAAPFVGSQT